MVESMSGRCPAPVPAKQAQIIIIIIIPPPCFCVCSSVFAHTLCLGFSKCGSVNYSQTYCRSLAVLMQICKPKLNDRHQQTASTTAFIQLFTLSDNQLIKCI